MVSKLESQAATKASASQGNVEVKGRHFDTGLSRTVELPSEDTLAAYLRECASESRRPSLRWQSATSGSDRKNPCRSTIPRFKEPASS